MFSIPSYYEFGSCPKSVNFLGGVVSSTAATHVVSSTSTAEEKAAAASKSHSEAERRRRKRINGHLATLRTLVPNTIKVTLYKQITIIIYYICDILSIYRLCLPIKFSCNNNEISKLKTLDRQGVFAGGGGPAAEGAEKNNRRVGGRRGDRESIPTEADELKLSYCEAGLDSGTIKATVCCEDRPELVSEMRRAVRAVEGRLMRAEMATVGGRIKTVLWVKLSAAVDGGGGEEGVGKLRRALKVVVDRGAWSAAAAAGQALSGNKRPRLTHY
ncbi:hypothetical protein NMG60_11007458 [Bertholletia excelsa]